MATRSRAARKMHWMMVRGSRDGTGLPSMVSFSRAAWMLAGKRASSRRKRLAAARRAVCGMSRPAAPRSSRMPVRVTSRPGFGKDGGTIRTRSALRLPQCAEAVRRNIEASAMRSGRLVLLSVAMPRMPAKRRAANAMARTKRGIIVGLV